MPPPLGPANQPSKLPMATVLANCGKSNGMSLELRKPALRHWVEINVFMSTMPWPTTVASQCRFCESLAEVIPAADSSFLASATSFFQYFAPGSSEGLRKPQYLTVQLNHWSSEPSPL